MTTSIKPSKALNISLWIAQVVLGSMFLMAGMMKSTKPMEAVALAMPWVSDFSTAMVRFIGVSEFLAGVGLMLPGLKIPTIFRS